MSGPKRHVDYATISQSVSGTRRWSLELECGHKTTRPEKSWMVGPFGHKKRQTEGAPKWVYCAECEVTP